MQPAESHISAPQKTEELINSASSTSTSLAKEEGSGTPGKLVLLIGPSGVGKSVILKKLRSGHPTLHFPRSATTRERRPGEGDELYHFMSDGEFDQLLAEEKFLETAIVHGGARYGTLIGEIIPYIQRGEIVVREVDVQGFKSISDHKLFSGKDAPYLLQSIFLLPESEEQLIEHITKRAPMTKEELAKRMESMKTELSFAERCNHQVTNREGKMQEAYEEIENLIFR
jgi:guanylate kinase